MKEFDIYLNKRLTECDIIVYSIPYRDGLTAMNQLILESCVESYTLTKFIAVQTGSELISHIDDMLKICHEKLSACVTFSASAEFETRYALYAESFPVVFSVDNVKVLANSFIETNNAMQFGAQQLDVYLAKPLGRGKSTMEIGASLVDTLKYSIEKSISSIQFSTTVEKTNVRYFADPGVGVSIGAELANLCYRIYDTVETATQITARVFDTEIHYSLGDGENSVELGAKSNGEYAAKYIAIENTVSLLSDVTESIKQFMAPEASAICFGIKAAFILKRCRMLAEMGNDDLAYYDKMMLESIDYVTI